MPAPILDIVMVSWNSGGQLRNCLESIGTARKDGMTLGTVVLVDNASSDGSTEGLDDFDLPLCVIRNAENRGFAAACNQGAATSGADYLLFLNPDCLLYQDSLATPIRFMEEACNRWVGICGIQLIDGLGCVWRSCTRFPTPRSMLSRALGLDRALPRFFPPYAMIEWDHLQSRPVDHTMGAFLLVRREVFEALSGFDERFFVYLEDLDLSVRAYRAGWSSFYLADTAAYHKGMGSSEQVKAARLAYALSSRIQYGFKHFSWIVAACLAIATLLFEPVIRLGLATGRRSRIEMRETLEGYAKLWQAASRRAKRGTWGPW